MGVFSEIKPQNTARKNPFDRGKYSSYNTKCGLMLPLKQWPTLPSSEYELDLKALMRTQPLGTAAFAGFSINYDVVWTPFNDHYSAYNQFIAQRLNKQHTTQPDIQNIPTFNPYQFFGCLLPFCVFDYLLAELPESERTQYYSASVDINVPTRSWFFSEHMPDESMALNCLRTLDLLRYGNYLPIVKGVVQAFKNLLDGAKYVDSAAKSLPYFVRYCALWQKDANNDPFYDWDDKEFDYDILSTWAFNINMDDYLYAFIQHVDFSGEGDNYLYPYGLTTTNCLRDNGWLTLWPVFCYNKAWWQFYRNEYYDIDYKFYFVAPQGTAFDYDEKVFEYVYMFNADDVNGKMECVPETLFSASSAFPRLLAMFAIKPHQYKKDLFTGLLPSTQYGSVSLALTDDDYHRLIGNGVGSGSIQPIVNNQVVSGSSSTSPRIMYESTDSTSGNVRSTQWRFDPALAINVLELRRADSLQRFKERMLRAGNKTKDIFKAHGWDEPFSEKAFEAEFFGTFDGRLDINVVASTTESEQVNLGQLGANGIGAIGGKTIRFKSHDFGTLMVIAYITKDAIYDAYGIDKCHMLVEPFDFPYPELQNVSLAPIVEKECNIYGEENHGNDVLGYLPQNMAYKTDTDTVHGEFFTVNPFVESDIPGHIQVAGIFANMVTPRLDISNAHSLSFFYIQPNCADNIFVENADETQASDQFFANVRFDLKTVQPLDVIGLPI